MSIVAKLSPLSVENYLAQEQQAQVRHEYIDGYIHAMVGASNHHNLLAGNLYSLFRGHLKGRSCTAFMADMKVRVESRFYYPDVLVACHADARERFYETEPVLIVEVLSPSTELTDAFQKRLDYQRLASLQDYILVRQDRMEVTLYRRAGEAWEMELCGPGDRLRCRSIGLEVPLKEIYEDAVWLDKGAP